MEYKSEKRLLRILVVFYDQLAESEILLYAHFAGFAVITAT